MRAGCSLPGRTGGGRRWIQWSVTVTSVGLVGGPRRMWQVTQCPPCAARASLVSVHGLSAWHVTHLPSHHDAG